MALIGFQSQSGQFYLNLTEAYTGYVPCCFQFWKEKWQFLESLSRLVWSGILCLGYSLFHINLLYGILITWQSKENYDVNMK